MLFKFVIFQRYHIMSKIQQYKENKVHAQEILEVLQERKLRNCQKLNAFQQPTYYRFDYVFQVPPNRHANSIIHLSKSLIKTVIKLENPGIISFTTATSPASGFVSGSKDHGEELLCHCSDLYQSLSSQSVRNFYTDRDHLTGVVVSSNIIFADQLYSYLSEPHTCVIVSCRQNAVEQAIRALLQNSVFIVVFNCFGLERENAYLIKRTLEKY